MGQDPGAVRQDIEQTRERMGDTIEALGHKTDVPGRAKEAASSRGRGQVKVGGAAPDSGDVKQGTRQAVGIAQENPIGLAIGAAAIGFVAGLLIPSTRVEDEKLGPVADQVKDKARETGQEAVQRGKEVAQQAAQAAQDAGREQAEGLRDSAADKAQDVRQQAG